MADSGEDIRSKILDHAARLLMRDGYAATTMQKVAKHAGIPLESVSRLFPSKYQLVRALFDGVRLHVVKRSDEIEARETDPRAIFHGWADVMREAAPRLLPLMLLIRDNAATDRDMADLQRMIDDVRLHRMAANAAKLERFGIEPARSRDVMWVATSAELYELLVVKRSWNLDGYGAFIEQLLTSMLLQ